LEDGGGNIVGTLVISDLAHTVAVLQNDFPVIFGGCFGLEEKLFEVDLVGIHERIKGNTHET
jgi:hypothetical protein